MLTHLSQELTSPILTVVSPWYFTGCFPLAFLEGYYLSSSPEMTSLCLDPMTWDPSIPSKRVASFSSTLFQSCWRYSNILFFFFFSSATLLLSTSFLAFVSASFLIFWAACLAQHNFTASSSWIRSHCSSLCLHYIFCHCFSSTSVLFCEMSEEVERYDSIKAKAKTFLFCLCIVDLSTIMKFSDKFNRTLNKLNRTSKAQF